jgi:hypothetical protein
LSTSSASRSALVVALLLAGCLGSAAEDEAARPPEEAGWREGLQTKITLDDVPPGSDWVLFEALVPAGTDITVKARAHHSTATGDACALFVNGVEHGALLWSGDVQLTLSGVSREPLVRTDSRYVGTSHSLLSAGAVDEDRRLAFAVGMDKASWRRTVDERAEMEVKFEKPARWRVAAAGKLHCFMNPHDFPEGEIVETPAFVKAQDLRARMPFNESGYGWLIVGAAPGAYSARLVGPSGEVWKTRDGEWSAASREEWENFLSLGSGEFTLEVPRLEGEAAVNAAFADLPAWVMESVQREMARYGADEAAEQRSRWEDPTARAGAAGVALGYSADLGR